MKTPNPRRYPKQFPGAAVGVAEEMRFVAMRLRNPKRTTLKENTGAAAAAEEDESEEEEEDDREVKEEENSSEVEEEEEEEEEDNHEVAEEGDVEVGEWMPSIEGFVSYLVDSKLVFDTVERVVAGSTDVACECDFSSPFFSTTVLLLVSYAVTSVDRSSPNLQCDACIYNFGPEMGFVVLSRFLHQYSRNCS